MNKEKYLLRYPDQIRMNHQNNRSKERKSEKKFFF